MRYFEDNLVGERRDIGSYTFTADEIKAFAKVRGKCVLQPLQGSGGERVFLVNADDPQLATWRDLHAQGALDLRVMHNVGMEASAKLVWGWANALLHDRDGGRSCCWKTEARENVKNAACYEELPEWCRG